jgi:hypothetical protein
MRASAIRGRSAEAHVMREFMTNSKRICQSLVLSLAFTLVLGACTDRSAPPDSTRSVNASDGDHAAIDKWLGQWNGPEGTFLRLAGGKGRYEVTIQDLDGPRTYQGTAVGAQIHFERNGAKESIRATNGAETGMKWLRDKSDCLTVRPGEGYCRD